MTDTATKRRLTVSTGGTGGPYLMVPVDQLVPVHQLLERNNISFWTDVNAISLDGEPAITVINFGRGGDAMQVQLLLDSAE